MHLMMSLGLWSWYLICLDVSLSDVGRSLHATDNNAAGALQEHSQVLARQQG